MQSKEDKGVLRAELRRLFQTLRPFTELPDTTIESYASALDDIGGPEAMVMVNTAIRTKWEYLPNPGELREIVMKFRDNQPPEPPRVCELCGGTKFRKMQLQEGYSSVIPCDCMSERGRDSMKDWIRKFNPQFVSRLSE